MEQVTVQTVAEEHGRVTGGPVAEGPTLPPPLPASDGQEENQPNH